MANKVVVTVVGTQRDDKGEENTIELISVGRMYTKNGIHYITYNESALSGMEGATTLIKLYSGHLSVVRMGSVEHKQEFRQGEKSYSTYITPYGTMKMNVYTNRLATAIVGASGTIDVNYELEIDGQWQSSNTLSIHIREDEQ